MTPENSEFATTGDAKPMVVAQTALALPVFWIRCFRKSHCLSHHNLGECRPYHIYSIFIELVVPENDRTLILTAGFAAVRRDYIMGIYTVRRIFRQFSFLRDVLEKHEISLFVALLSNGWERLFVNEE